jgi:hypothetical protein
MISPVVALTHVGKPSLSCHLPSSKSVGTEFAMLPHPASAGSASSKQKYMRAQAAYPSISLHRHASESQI